VIPTLPSPEALNRLACLHLQRRVGAPGAGVNSRRGQRPGSSREFLGLRPYEIGDDVRDLDWAASLRFDRPYLRLYRQEVESSLLLLVDASASMGQGEPSKWAYAQGLACALGHVALAHADRVGALAFNESLVARLPVGRRPGQWRALRDALGAAAPCGRTEFGVVPNGLAAMRGLHGVAVIVSDFLPPEGFAEGLRRLARSPLHLVALQVLSPQDLAPSVDGEVELVDSETDEARGGWVGRDERARYAQALSSCTTRLAGICREAGARLVQTSTAVPVVRCLQDTLVRAGVLGRGRS
jgi:uncharacterized protein (DUF58 family)